MILSAIAAMAQNRVIGINNQLPWDLPEDMKYFREKTKGKILIMGRKTFESFPKPLPGRYHIVISRNSNFTSSYEKFSRVANVEQALSLAENLIPQYEQEVFVVGGSEIYQQLLGRLNRIYLTVIEKDFKGDSYFPEFESKHFRLTQSQAVNGEIPYKFQVFDKI